MATPSRQTNLPLALRRLVSWSVAILGDVIRRDLGPRAYRNIEALRRDMAGMRRLDTHRQHDLLRDRLARLRKLSRRERREIAHAFTLMLELMNACEAAYRSFRIAERESAGDDGRKSGDSHMTWVLTAHPTEARSPENIDVFHRIQQELTAVLRSHPERPERSASTKLKNLIGLAWKARVARERKPSVADEADHIYSIALRPEVLRSELEASADSRFGLRTWVGGDKDGHSGVDEKAMMESLSLSRKRIVSIAEAHCASARADARIARDRELEEALRDARAALRSLRRLRVGEFRQIRLFAQASLRARDLSAKLTGTPYPALAELRALLGLFPALVMPLELRDSRGEIGRAARGENVAIRRMLSRLAALSRGGEPRAYAGSLIISVTEGVEDVRAGLKLVRETLGGPKLPVVPLLEKRSALENAAGLTRAMIRDRAIRSSLRALNRGRSPGDDGTIEIMLGYSDSAKEVGALASRTEIILAMREIESACKGSGLRPLFFHGAGGSVDRGGGSIQEQTEGWPREALLRYKVTVQGEMIERSLASPEILRSQLRRIPQTLASRPRRSRIPSAVTQRFAHAVSVEYRNKVSSPGFMDLVHSATAYRYLHELRIGSRPSSRPGRAGSGSEATPLIESLRAIPWVLCWTQARILFPVWWGIGSAWEVLDSSERKSLRAELPRDPLLRSFVKLLGFTLAKVELAVWRIHLEASRLPREQAEKEFSDFEREYRLALGFVRALSGKRDLLWFRPWLGTSIRLRSPMIHPLNLIQILAFEERDGELIRETVTGIASGMMTTG